jgi:conjugative relaxase-like TrwC/TraI family protein
MLIINPASASGIDYWQRSADHSTWFGRGATALGLAGPVGTTALRDVLLGRQPGGPALTARPGLRRRHGWDLVVAAPKSVSLLAVAGGDLAAPLRMAYRQGIADTLEALEDHAAWVAWRGGQAPARGVIAGGFEHLGNNDGQPHVHTHVILANLGILGDGGWGCLVGRELWRWREALGAGFQLALRSRLAQAGFGFEWEISDGGLGEISSVPKPARNAASARSRAARAGSRRFGTTSGAASRVAQAATRLPAPSAMTPSPESDPQPGSLDREQAATLLRRARARPALPPPPPSGADVAQALAQRGSAFSQPDVLVALAETSPGGLDLRQASEWSSQWCEAGVSLAPQGQIHAGTGRAARTWTTSLARHLDRQVIEQASEARFAHLAEVNPALAVPELGALGVSGPLAAIAARLACSGEGVSVLPRAPWLAQAACIDAARAVWQAAGMAVRVSSPSELADRRWRALTSLGPAVTFGAGNLLEGTRPGCRAVVVDAADHLSPATLCRLLRQAAASRTKLVLVAGGTVAGRGDSLARSFDHLVEELAPSGLSELGLAGPGGWVHPPVRLDGIVVEGSLTGTDAMAHLVAGWQTAGRSHARPLMVAFGPAEAQALNLAARSVLRPQVGPGPPPGATDLVLGQRHYGVGEEVMALRRIGAIRSATRGTVVAVEPRSLTVAWQAPSGPITSIVGEDQAASLGYGYATTVPYLRSCDMGDNPGPLLVLGDPLALGGRSSLVRRAWVTVPGPGIPALGPDGYRARQRAGIGELATGWPDEEILARAGPRPLSGAARRRWAGIVTACALERSLQPGLRNSLQPGVTIARQPEVRNPPPAWAHRGPTQALNL